MYAMALFTAKLPARKPKLRQPGNKMPLFIPDLRASGWLQIVDGSLWVYHVSMDKVGWYPAELGPGNVAAKGRVPYALLAIMETLRMFPGQV